MTYEVLKKAYSTLTPEQQMVVYNLVISLMNLNLKSAQTVLPRRQFGKFAGLAKASFSENWEMSPEELCSL